MPFLISDAMRSAIPVVVLFLKSLSGGSSAILEDDDGIYGGGPHFDLFDFPFADPVTWAADASNASNKRGLPAGFQGEKSRA